MSSHLGTQRQKRPTGPQSTAQRRASRVVSMHEGGRDHEVQLTLLEEVLLPLSGDACHDAKTAGTLDELLPMQVNVSIYSCYFKDVVSHKNNGMVRIHVSVQAAAVQEEADAPGLTGTGTGSEAALPSDMLSLSVATYDPSMNALQRKKLIEAAVTIVFTHFGELEAISGASEDAVASTSVLSVNILKEVDSFVHGSKRTVFDNSAYAQLNREKEVQRFREVLHGCHLGHRTAGETQEILNSRNAGNANISLHDLLGAASTNVSHLIVLLRERCTLLCTSKIGYSLPDFSPWSVQWLDAATMKEAVALVSSPFLHSLHYVVHFCLFILIACARCINISLLFIRMPSFRFLPQASRDC